VSRPRVAVEGGHVRQQAGAHGVEVDIAHEFQEVGVLLHNDRLEPILKEVTVAMVAPVELTSVAAEHALHEP
jgi:hypothetical protein